MEDQIKSVCDLLTSEKDLKIFFMIGAGISTAAGIPDFRSPKTGLYANLARLNLPFAEAVFEINYFRRNPVPFYTLARELYPGQFRPTLTHAFIRLLEEKSLLHTCFTQNIDTLERLVGVSDSKIVEAHGSFANQKCIDCSKNYDQSKMKEAIFAPKITIPKCSYCRGLVKPDIVFFGEGLPDVFHRTQHFIRSADVLFVIGTSLTVQPFASLSERVPESCSRVLINMELVGDFGHRKSDIHLLGKCDAIITQICEKLGWQSELQRIWRDASVDKTDAPSSEGGDEVERLTDKVAASLRINESSAKAGAPGDAKEKL